jgi:hypothetical protein
MPGPLQTRHRRRFMWSAVVGSDALMQTTVWNTNRLREVRQDHPLSVMDNPDVISPIAGLLPSGCPATVAGLVIPVDVDAVKSSAGGPRPHVAQECGEVVAPGRAHRNSAGTVIHEIVVVGIEASRFRIEPCVVFGRFSGSDRMSVGLCTGNELFGSQATATRRVAAGHRANAVLDLGSAVASRPPNATLRATLAGPFNGDKATEPLSSDVFRNGHVAEYIRAGSVVQQGIA